MKNKWRAYGGITVILLLIACIIFIRFDYQRLLEQSRQEVDKHQETEQLLRSKKKQLTFYFNKVNELILANQELKVKMDSLDGGGSMRTDDQLVWDAIDSEEYKEIMARYREYYGIMDEIFIPKNETLGGLRYKVEESITAGYDLLPSYYGISNVLMCVDTKEFIELNALMKEHFG